MAVEKADIPTNSASERPSATSSSPKKRNKEAVKERFGGLRRYLEKLKPSFSEVGRFPWLHSTFETLETFAFTP